MNKMINPGNWVRPDAVVWGASLGGMEAIKYLLSELPEGFRLPVIGVQHIGENSESNLAVLLNRYSEIEVREAEEKEPIQSGILYLAPAGYHLLVEPDHTFSLSIEERVNYARPSIDVLFETAADAYRSALIGVVLTGANADGARGLRSIREKGGLCIVQDPCTADAPAMPLAAIRMAEPQLVLPVAGITKLLLHIHNNPQGIDYHEI